MFLLQELIDKGAIKVVTVSKASTVVVAKELPSEFCICRIGSRDEEKGDEADTGRSGF